MPAGKLSVTPLTINGLAQNGYPTSHTFIGCYVSQSEKHRTSSASGPEPHFQDTLKCIVGENDETLFLDVVNEDPSRPGLIGSAKLPLSSVFESGIFENWVPLVTSTGQPLGHIYMKLAFTSSNESTPSYAAPPYHEQKTEVNQHTDAPQSPIPNLQQRSAYGQNYGPPSYVSPSQSFNTGAHGPYPVAGAAPSYGAGNAYSPVAGKPPVAGTPPVTGVAPVAGVLPVATTEKPKKNVPDWMKYGGAAVAGAAAVGLGAWAVDALGSDEEEERAELEKKAFEAGQQSSMEQEAHRAESYHTQEQQQRSFNQEQEEVYKGRQKEEEERYEERKKEEEELYEKRLEEEEERREEEEEHYKERLEEEEKRREEEEERRKEEEEEEREEEEEEREEEEEEREEEEEERLEEEEEEREEREEEEEERREEEEEEREEEEEEREEEYHDREIQPERPAVNDSKWR